MRYNYRTKFTCAQMISFDIDENHVITDIQFMGGCDGNLKAVAKLVDGMTAEEIAAKLKGNTCGRKPTSCADQLASAVMTAVEEMAEE